MLGRYNEEICVFCDPLDERNKVLIELKNWREWDNPFLKGAAALHRVMAPTHHLSTMPIGLTIADFEAMGDLFVWTQHDKKELFGNPRDNWEAHIIVPDLSGNVQFTLGAKDFIPQHSLAKVPDGFSAGGWHQIVNERELPHTGLHLLLKPTINEPLALSAEDFTELGEIVL